MIQGSEEWIAARVGKVTASRVGDVLTRPRKGHEVSAVRERYLADLLAERLTGNPTVKHYAGDESPLAWGRQNEPAARVAYELFESARIVEVGFIDHPRIPMSGASPDGLVGADGGVEIKCPNTDTHRETLRTGKAPRKYLPQIKWNMACNKRAWWDFVSFDPRLPLDEQYFCQRVFADPDEIRAMEAAVFAFLLELEARLESFRAGEAA